MPGSALQSEVVGTVGFSRFLSALVEYCFAGDFGEKRVQSVVFLW
jgi:hypothetical protein